MIYKHIHKTLKRKVQNQENLPDVVKTKNYNEKIN